MCFISVIVIYLDNGAKILVYLQILIFFLECTLVHVFFHTMLQMNRSWVHGRLFSGEHIDGVKEFRTSFKENSVRMRKHCAHVVDALIINTLFRLL
jgi:hypothetical protein